MSDQREEGVGWAKRAYDVHDEIPVSPDPARVLLGVAPPTEGQTLEDQLFLSLRQCATHPAGPMRAVAELHRLDDQGDDVAAIVERVRLRFLAMDMPDDRRDVGRRFLAVIEAAFA